MPDFPDELVEAAAKAAMEAEPGQNWECATAKEADVYLRDSLAVLTAVLPLIEQRARLDERERLSSRVHENGWCPTCARDTDEAAMQRLAGKSLESLSRNDLIGLALRNLNAAMDAEARADAAEQRVIDRLAREAGSRKRRTGTAWRCGLRGLRGTLRVPLAVWPPNGRSARCATTSGDATTPRTACATATTRLPSAPAGAGVTLHGCRRGSRPCRVPPFPLPPTRTRGRGRERRA